MPTSMRISESTRRELVKIGAEFSAKDGIARSMEDIVLLLVEEHNSRKPHEGKGSK